MGVAVVLAVDLTRSSALRAFDLANDRVFGRTTDMVVGVTPGMDEALYRTLRVDWGLTASAPVVTGPAWLPDDPASVSVLGIDIFADAAVRGFTPGLGDGWPAELFLSSTSGMVSADLVPQIDGDTLSLIAAGRVFELPIVHVLPDEERIPRRTVVVDIATAQELLDEVGQLSRIDLYIPAGEEAERVRAKLSSRLPPSVELQSAARQSESVRRLTRAFSVNLVALGLLSVLVGMFLIHNTVTFLVLLRREQFGRLRALGVTGAEVRRAVFLEVGVIAAIGIAIGLAMGYVLASAMLGAVARTVNDLYFAATITRLELTPGLLLKAALVGAVSSLVAAWLPARSAAQSPPRVTMQRYAVEDQRRRWQRAGLVAAPIFGALSAAVLVWPSGGLIAGLIGLFLIIVAAVCLSPTGLDLALRGVRFGTGSESSLGLAARLASGTLSRTSVAAAALMVAVATTLGIGLMIDSFRASVDQWLTRLLQADIYLSASGSGSTLESGVADQIRELDSVQDVTTVRRIRFSLGGDDVFLIAYDLNDRGYSGFEWLGSKAPTAPEFRAGRVVGVSEPLARRLEAKPGDVITVPTPVGPQRLLVGGIYRDYGNQRGAIAIAQGPFQRWFGDQRVTGIGIYLNGDADAGDFQSELSAALGGERRLDVASNRAIRETSLRIFDRTFLVTQVLRALTGLVAFAGVLGALMAVMIERAREFATLRALGFTQRQVRHSILIQSALVGGFAGLAALPLGVAVALALIHAVNVRAFGWTMSLRVDPAALGQALLIAVAAAVAAAIYPSVRAASSDFAADLRSS